jgi:hypothetical protein
MMFVGGYSQTVAILERACAQCFDWQSHYEEEGGYGPELLDQIESGGTGLCEEDMYLLDINLDNLGTSSGEDQTYWLPSFRAARVAFQVRD